MKVTPLDLRRQTFRQAMRGFDRAEVTAFLSEVADEYEQALRETDRLQQEATRLEALLNEHREHERDLRNTLLAAQRLGDDIKAAAEQEARRVVREAEGRADLLLEKAQARAEDIQRDIEALRMKRREAHNAVESTIKALDSALEFAREQDRRDRVDSPRTAPPAPPPERSMPVPVPKTAEV
ncbi:MAG: DivIVA domain-containing protein [Bacteroidales bacterium]